MTLNYIRGTNSKR